MMNIEFDRITKYLEPLMASIRPKIRFSVFNWMGIVLFDKDSVRIGNEPDAVANLFILEKKDASDLGALVGLSGVFWKTGGGERNRFAG